MKTLRVAIHRHIFPDIGNGRLPCFVQPVTGPFPLQAAEEPFHRCIVPSIGRIKALSEEIHTD
jgi:hypothetical protein